MQTPKTRASDSFCLYFFFASFLVRVDSKKFSIALKLYSNRKK
jgi:hypothetical protein